jgi:primosomal protein N' (replication factor Y)
VETDVRSPKVKIRFEKVVAFADLDADVASIGRQLRGEKQRAIVSVLAGMKEDGDYPARKSELLKTSGASAASLRALVEKGLLLESEREFARHVGGDPRATPVRTPGELTLHEEQRAALDKIRSSIAGEEFQTFMLHGITGSGKTEVYIRALKQVLDLGKTGIILVPEIALTPQTVSRFTAHFGDDIAVLHSRMAVGERFDSWRYIREGRHRVVIGPRSAILAPLQNLGLVVVDEEHEHTYKQFDPAPRYHARDIAIVRAQLNAAVCVLGSATPSLESYANAKAGKYIYLEMKSRAPTAGAADVVLPSVHVVDLTKEKKRNRLEGIVSGPLRSAIAARLRAGEQTILLQNRRGYSPTIECTACGWAPVCPDCSVTMTYHKAGRAIRCHYCGRVERYPAQCPQCESRALLNIGVGTQRVEEELKSLFPDARILRMDFDTTSRKNAHHAILERFGQGRADILLGTQMVAKGLDFDRVTLVGVVDADTGLLFPDFRAEERTFQLLTQVAGRAGRGGRAGEVFLQTRNVGSPAITFALQHDYAGFAEYALRHRAALSYPPFGRLVAVYFRGPEEARVRLLSEEWTDALRREDGQLNILGPHPAFVARVRNQFRYVSLVKVPQRYGHDRLRNALKGAGEVKAPSKYFVVVDVDAMGLF